VIQPPHDGRIPARIFQTWKTKSALPHPYALWSASFAAHNPGFERVLWDDDDNARLIGEHFPWFFETYKGYPKEIYRADAVRYFFLYANGGIYADLDAECLRPLDHLLGRGDIVLGRMGSDPDHPHAIPNAIMASKPRQEFWLLVIWLMSAMAKNQASPEYMTGPVVLKAAVDLYRAQDPLWVRSVVNTITAYLSADLQPVRQRCEIALLPSREWFPIDWTDPIHQMLRRQGLGGRLLSDSDKKLLFPAASMVTYWAHGW